MVLRRECKKERKNLLVDEGTTNQNRCFTRLRYHKNDLNTPLTSKRVVFLHLNGVVSNPPQQQKDKKCPIPSALICYVSL